MKRTFGLLSLLATIVVGAGCGQMTLLDGASPDASLQATSHETAERAILRALRERYPDHAVYLESVRRGEYRDEYTFTATVASRRVTGTYDSYSGRVTVRDDDDTDPGNLVTIRREIRRELENRYTRAYVDVLDVRRGTYRDEFRFTARIDERRVDGTYNSTIRRITIRDDGYDPNPPNEMGEIRRVIMDQLRRRFPFQSITRFDMEAPNGTNYRFSVYVDGEQRFGFYDSTNRQVRIY